MKTLLKPSVEAARRMTSKYDFVVTSGGIGPTHDDITYESLGVAFDLPLEYHQETKNRMMGMTSPERKKELESASEAVRKARDRMALFPTSPGGHVVGGEGEYKKVEGATSEVIFVEGDKWVPVVRLAGKVCFICTRVVLNASFACFPVSLRSSNNSYWA